METPIAQAELLEDLKNNWSPMIPFEVIALIVRAGFVKDVVSFVRKLQPMLYVYWR